MALCAGVGGLELGLRLALGDTYRTVVYVEREAYAAATLVARMEDAALDRAPVWDDVSTFDARRWRGVVDLVSAGYPCQPFSVAGKRRGSEDERHLWPEVSRIASECEPSVVFLENVAGHLRLGFREVADELRGMGYSVAAGLFTAAECGAPHRRERLFALAYREGCGGGLLLQQRGPRGSGDEPERRGEDVGNSAGPRWVGWANASWEGWPLRDEARRARSSGSGSGPMADTSAASVHEAQAGGPRDAGSSAGRGVGNTDDAGLEGRRGPIGECGNELPAWPPGPSGDWGDIAAHLWPATESRLRGLADGMAPRMDRLRAAGNGVVPVVAAYAFRTLAEALC